MYLYSAFIVATTLKALKDHLRELSNSFIEP